MKKTKLIELLEGSTRLQAIVGDLVDSRGSGFENISRPELRKMLDLPEIIEVPKTFDYSFVESSFEVIDEPGLTEMVMKSLIEKRKRIGGTFEVMPDHFADKVTIEDVAKNLRSNERCAGLPELIAFIKDPHNRAKSRRSAVLACEKFKIGDKEYIFVAGYLRNKSTLYVIPYNTKVLFDVGTIFLHCKRIQS